MSIFDPIFELIFPARCVNCGRLGDFICPKCYAKVVPIREQSCPICNKISPQGKTCPRCRRKTDLLSVTSCGYLKDPILKNIVTSYKYEKLSAMAPLLAKMLSAKIIEEKLKFDVLIPVAISRKRKAWRGFNQSELLAKELSKILDKPYTNALKKVKDTKTQVGLTRKGRNKNLRNVFACIDSSVVGKKVLLIDDVITTGATLTESARVLKSAGSQSVLGLTLAKE
jgi:competence protein ComFC